MQDIYLESVPVCTKKVCNFIYR